MRPPVLLLSLALSVGASAGCSGESAPTGPPPGQPPPIVVALGDSLTAGLGVSADEAYPALLQERMRAQGYTHRVVNAGISGDTSAGALSRLDRALTGEVRVMILALGANDGLQGVPIDELRGNLSAIIERAQARNIRVLLCGMETPPTRGWEFTLAFHRVYPELAARYRLPLMPFLLDGIVGDPAYNLADRFHPNAAGYRRIAQTMWPYLEPLLRETS